MSSQPISRDQLDDVFRPEAREALKHLELHARRLVEGIRHGIHRSRRKGVSTEFDHHKLYQPGDPLKHIDWKVSARHQHYFVKRYLEDTALSVRLIVDQSASMRRTTGELPSKFTQAARLAAAIAYVILKERDSVGLALTNSEESVWLPAGSSERHLVRILQALVERRPDAGDSVEGCLQAVLDRGDRKGMVVLFSDLMFPPDPVQRRLAQLTAQGHEVLLFQLRDPGEEDFPFNRWVQFENLEIPGQRQRIDTVPLKKIYRQVYQDLMANWQTWAAKHSVHLVSSRTDAAMDTLLSAYLIQRQSAGQ